jgi:hypothetical protein
MKTLLFPHYLRKHKAYEEVVPVDSTVAWGKPLKVIIKYGRDFMRCFDFRYIEVLNHHVSSTGARTRRTTFNWGTDTKHRKVSNKATGDTKTGKDRTSGHNKPKSRDSSVGIATSYVLDGVTASRPALGPTQPPIQWVKRALSLGIKWPGREADHSPPCSAEVKNGEAIRPLPNTSSWRGG